MSLALEPIAAVSQAPALPTAEIAVGRVDADSFARLLTDGVEGVNAELLAADRMTQAFALGEDVPVHQVTYALEHARLSFELMSQVRTRLLEAYQELMRMPV